MKKDEEINRLNKIILRYPFLLSENEKIINLIITSFDHKINLPIICKNSDKFEKIIRYFYDEYPQYTKKNNSFLGKNGKIILSKTIEENQINDKDIILIYSENS